MTEVGEVKTSGRIIDVPSAKISGLRSKWQASPDASSASRFDDVKSIRDGFEKTDSLYVSPVLTPTGYPHRADTGQKRWQNAIHDIVLQYTYPRIDAEVSKHRNHLLKSPFCVHPGTGRVCVPVDPARVDEFDPEAVPTVGRLLSELNKLGTETASDDKARKLEGQSLHTDVMCTVADRQTTSTRRSSRTSRCMRSTSRPSCATPGASRKVSSDICISTLRPLTPAASVKEESMEF